MTQDPNAGLETILDHIRYAYSRLNASDTFFGHGTDNAWDEAVHLVLRSLHLPWDADLQLWSSRMTPAERQCIADRIEARIVQRIPLPYLLEEAWFMELPFYVNRDVLIPRSPIAELLRNECRPWLGERSPKRILDLCCGSGCIGIAAAYVFDQAEIVLSDIDEKALQVARHNVERHGLADRIQVIQSDLYDKIQGRFDLILTNPPYVDADDMASLPLEYHAEPVLALASGTDGLDCTRRILDGAGVHLQRGGLLIGEVGNSLPALLETRSELPFLIPDLERGGSGLFVIEAMDLQASKTKPAEVPAETAPTASAERKRAIQTGKSAVAPLAAPDSQSAIAGVPGIADPDLETAAAAIATSMDAAADTTSVREADLPESTGAAPATDAEPVPGKEKGKRARRSRRRPKAARTSSPAEASASAAASPDSDGDAKGPAQREPQTDHTDTPAAGKSANQLPAGASPTDANGDSSGASADPAGLAAPAKAPAATAKKTRSRRSRSGGRTAKGAAQGAKNTADDSPAASDTASA